MIGHIIALIASVLNFSSDVRTKLALKRQNDILWQRFLAIEDRIAKSRAKHEAVKARVEREYLKATGKVFAPIGGRT